MKNKPNFFIVGAPRCGTTALSEYLRTHPNIFMTQPKEPNYFAEDFYRPITTLNDYYSLFNRVSSEHLAIGEGSVVYLFSKTAIPNLKDFTPNAKLIVMVRNPIQMIPSLHSRLLVTLYEDEKDFEKAWFLQAERQKGENIPKTCRSPRFLEYKNIGCLGTQLERLFEIFDRSHVKVIVFDDFAAATKEVYEDTLSFLGVPSDGKVDFPKVNVNKISRPGIITRLAQRPPERLVKSYRRVKNTLNLGAIGLLRRINKLTSEEAEREAITQNMKEELRGAFRDDILLLSDLLERDLTHWLAI